jgi:uncharacterized protein (TIGR02001 family)
MPSAPSAPGHEAAALPRALLSALLAALALGAGTRALAQVGVSAVLQSDYRYRGRSLSDGRPTLSLNLAYDHASGAYAGASAIFQDSREYGVGMLGHVIYAGYVFEPARGPALDIGMTHTHVVEYRFGKRKSDYAEAYAGLLTEHVSFRVYYAPDYYESGIHTIYADLGLAIRPAPDMRLFGHVGALSGVGGRNGPGARRVRYDFSVGAARRFDNLELSLTWTLAAPTVYARGRRQRPDALTLAAAYFF